MKNFQSPLSQTSQISQRSNPAPLQQNINLVSQTIIKENQRAFNNTPNKIPNKQFQISQSPSKTITGQIAQKTNIQDEQSKSPISKLQQQSYDLIQNIENKLYNQQMPETESGDDKMKLAQENQRLNEIIQKTLEENQNLKKDLRNRTTTVNFEKMNEKINRFEELLKSKDKEIEFWKSQNQDTQNQQMQLQDELNQQLLTTEKYREAFQKIEQRILDVISENESLTNMVKEKDQIIDNIQKKQNNQINYQNSISNDEKYQNVINCKDKQIDQYELTIKNLEEDLNEVSQVLQKYENFQDLEEKTNLVIEENDRMTEALNKAKETLEQFQQENNKITQNNQQLKYEILEQRKTIENLQVKKQNYSQTIGQYKQLCQQIKEQANLGVEYVDEYLN